MEALRRLGSEPAKLTRRAATGGFLGALVVGAALAFVLTDRNPGHLPVVLVTTAVAVFGIAVTAWTTDRRQDRQLSHERERQEAQIEAEQDRLQAQLGAEQDRLRAELGAEYDRLLRRFQHERITNDMAELRVLLDGAAKDLSDAQLSDNEFKDHRHLIKLRWSNDPPPEAVERQLQLTSARSAAIHRARASQERIAMRLGFGTRVGQHYTEAVDALTEGWDIEHGDDAKADRRDRLLREHGRAKAMFIDAAKELIATAEEIAQPPR